jgi:lysozyme family protein
MRSSTPTILLPRKKAPRLSFDSNGFLTKYGINQKYHPDVDVRTLTPEQARAIRYNEYWVPLNADTLANKDPKIAMMAYDTAILAR